MFSATSKIYWLIWHFLFHYEGIDFYNVIIVFQRQVSLEYRNKIITNLILLPHLAFHVTIFKAISHFPIPISKLFPTPIFKAQKFL